MFTAAPKPLRVLLVEDSRDDADLLVRELQKAYTVTCERITDPSGLLRALESQPWDIVIADYVLPQFDGLKALALLKQTGADIPFIMMSGKLGEEMAVAAMKAGAHDYLLKDNLSRLLPAVERELRESAERRERRRVQESLAQHQAMLELAVEAADLGTWDLNLVSGHFLWSDHAKRLFGLLPGAPMNYRTFLRAVHPNDRRATHQAISRAVRKRKDYDIEFRVVWPDAQVRWIAAKGRAFHNEAGQPLRMTGVALDVTEKKKTEAALRRAHEELEQRVAERTAELAQANQRLCAEITERQQVEASLRQSEQRFQAFMDHTPALAFIKNEEGRYVYCNRRFENLFGKKSGDLLGKTDAELFSGNAAAQMRADDQTALDSGQGLERVEQLATADGRVHAWMTFRFPIRDAADRRFLGGVAVDVTERARAEEALRRSELRLRRLVESNIIGIYIADFTGRITDANGAFLDMLGYTREDLRAGRLDWQKLTPPEFEPVDRRAAEQLRRPGVCTPAEKQFFRKDGSRVPVFMGAAVFDPADPRGEAVAYVLDITARKELERELLRVSEREQQRIGGDLHDGLCQHLTGVKFRSAILQRKLERKAPEEAREAALVADLVSQAIDQARSLAQGLHPVKLEANGLMSALQELAAHVESVFGCQCACRFGRPVLLHDNNVAVHFYRIAQEAITNAIRHGKAGKITVGLSARKGSIALTVQDDGVGFPVHPPRQTGMGLRIMNYRAGMIAATLEVCRLDPRGTRVTCRWRRNVAT
jgi:PAS domain S-box-containing protein